MLQKIGIGAYTVTKAYTGDCKEFTCASYNKKFIEFGTKLCGRELFHIRKFNIGLIY